MIGKTISHYKILEELGEGGMGKVYKAEDTKLKRTVALKFLPHHLIAGKSIKERFFHEARAASALNHPNIITIYDIHEEDGEVFLAMECVDGIPLSDKLKDGPLKQKELIGIASGIADGLNAAHNAEITHRDIKAENIIIAKDGQAKIIDFGLAKQKGMSQITQDGTTLGTQSYMSPEQVQGIKIDQRSDIFSFGVVLYQMATGKLPFEEEHEAAILYSIVNEAPIPVTTHNPNLDEELQRIISKALEKDVKDRYQHADDLLADLRKLKKGKSQKPVKRTPKWLIPSYIVGGLLVLTLLYTLKKKDTTIEPTIGNKSIAVLPFTTIDRTEESEIFSAGIHDDILSQIAKIHDLKVVSRTSVIRYKDTEKSIKEIAQELGVETILEGSVRRYGEKVRIVAQLINAKTDDHLWTDTYDRDYIDIFTIQSDVAQKIAGALNATLTSQELQAINEIPTDNLEAYGYYQQGKIIFSKAFTIENVESATALFEKAVELDPDFMLAYVELCLSYLRIYWIHEQLPKDYLQYAKLALNKIQKLDPNHSSVHLVEGFYYYYGFRDYDKALESWSSALKDRPNDSGLLAAIGLVKRRQGKWEHALELLIKASDIDPQFSSLAYTVGGTARYMRKWKLAEQYNDRSILINPLYVDAYDAKINYIISATGDIDKARTVLREALNHVHLKDLIGSRALIEFYSRNYLKALEIQQEYQKKGNIANMQDFWVKGNYSLFAGKIELSNSYFDSLKILGEKAIKKDPKDWNGQFYLAMAYSQLGRIEDAIKTANVATNLMPISLDALYGSAQRIVLVVVYGTAGDFDKAIDELDYLLSIPSIFSVNYVKNYPLFDPLRDHPRFQELIEKYEHTEG